MRKILLFVLLLIARQSLFAQNVGIGTTTPSEQLHTTGTVRFEKYGYDGVVNNGDRILKVNKDGVLTAATVQPIFTSNAANNNLAIPDNQCPSGGAAIPAQSIIAVSGVSGGTLSVKINVTHTYLSDLKIFLVSPDGRSICLVDGAGGSGDNFTNTIFADGGAAIGSGSAPFTGVFAPLGIAPFCVSGNTLYASFSTFSYASPIGDWALRVYDKAAGDVGKLVNWEITFGGPENFSSETTISGNVAFKIGNPAPNKVLTALNTKGHAEWKDPVQFNSGFNTKLAGGFVCPYSATGVVVPFSRISTLGTTTIDDGGNFVNTDNVYRVPADGVYQFNVSLDMNQVYNSTSGNLLILRLISNGSVIASQYLSAPAGSPLPVTMHLSVVRKVLAGQDVSVNIFNNTGTNMMFNNASSDFSGVRIY